MGNYNLVGGQHPGNCPSCGHILQWGGVCANCSRKAAAAKAAGEQRRARDAYLKKQAVQQRKLDDEVKRLNASLKPFERKSQAAAARVDSLLKQRERASKKIAAIHKEFESSVRSSKKKIESLQRKLAEAQRAAAGLEGRRDKKLQAQQGAISALEKQLGPAQKKSGEQQKILAKQRDKVNAGIAKAKKKYGV